jgi:hypothetical protein
MPKPFHLFSDPDDNEWEKNMIYSQSFETFIDLIRFVDSRKLLFADAYESVDDGLKEHEFVTLAAMRRSLECTDKRIASIQDSKTFCPRLSGHEDYPRMVEMELERETKRRTTLLQQIAEREALLK